MLSERNNNESLLGKEEISIATAIEACLEQSVSFAMYRRPQSESIFLVIDFSKGSKISKPEVEALDPGFIFGPFMESTSNPIWYIKADVLLILDNGSTKMHINPNLSASDALDRFLATTYSKSNGSHSPRFYQATSPKGNPDNPKEEYLDLVQSSMKAIRNGLFQKVVPARSFQKKLPADFNPLKFFDRLCKTYHSAMVSLVSLPKAGTWIGATPEALLALDRNNTFSTSALAGTQPFDRNMPLRDAAWTQKEIEEQAMVSRYIINCFKRIRLREFEELGPRTINAGNVIHLETKYTVNMDEVQYPQLGSVMLELLHPTSAVCGLPKIPAMEFLEKNEKIERSYYSGYLGPVNINKEVLIFVNLRCMQLVAENACVLYSGAGVTANSNPEKEWAETNLKMKTLLEVMS